LDVAIDVGAGIGRITQKALRDFFGQVDLMEQCPAYIDKAKEILGANHNGEFYTIGCQEFNFTKKYDVIWIQWVVGHLTDKDFVDFLVKCKANLNPQGIIVCKENLSSGCFIVDKDDCTIIRDEQYFKAIFEKAGLNIMYEQDLANFPQDYYRVVSYVLR